MGMSEPMGRDRLRQLRPPGRGLDDAMHLGRIEMPALNFITSFLIALGAAILHRMID